RIAGHVTGAGDPAVRVAAGHVPRDLARVDRDIEADLDAPPRLAAAAPRLCRREDFARPWRDRRAVRESPESTDRGREGRAARGSRRNVHGQSSIPNAWRARRPAALAAPVPRPQAIAQSARCGIYGTTPRRRQE